MKLILSTILAVAMVIAMIMPTEARQPNGYEVKGCAYYKLVNYRVVHDCDWRTRLWSINGGAADAGPSK